MAQLTTARDVRRLVGTPEPRLHFPHGTLEGWRRAGLSLAEISQVLEDMRKAVKAAIGYFWDNSAFVIEDIYGQPALRILVNEDGIDLWEANFRTSVGHFAEIPGDTDAMLAQVSNRLVRCSECGGWFPPGEWVHYGFAGAVCKAHYDPKRHRQPDTRGD